MVALWALLGDLDYPALDITTSELSDSLLCLVLSRLDRPVLAAAVHPGAYRFSTLTACSHGAADGQSAR